MTRGTHWTCFDEKTVILAVLPNRLHLQVVARGSPFVTHLPFNLINNLYLCKDIDELTVWMMWMLETMGHHLVSISRKLSKSFTADTIISLPVA